MAQDQDLIDQEALAAAWDATINSAGSDDNLTQHTQYSQWRSMIESAELARGATPFSDDVISQDELDSIIGFDLSRGARQSESAIRGLINSPTVVHDPLPMLEVVCDRLLRLMTTSLRRFTFDNVEIAIESIESRRIGDYLDTIPLPSMFGVINAQQWNERFLLISHASLSFAMIDVLLGGAQGHRPRIACRPFTPVEIALSKRMLSVILNDLKAAFRPVTNIDFELERIESNPRFATISRLVNAAVVCKMRIDMDVRSGDLDLVMPYATLEPVRPQLMKKFQGEKLGADTRWNGRMAFEAAKSFVTLKAILFEQRLPLAKLYKLKPGDTLLVEHSHGANVTVRCGKTELALGLIKDIRGHVAIEITSMLTLKTGSESIADNATQKRENSNEFRRARH